MTFDEWAQYGYEQGWCSPPVCYTHHYLPLAPEEFNNLYDGDDSCIHLIRLYQSAEHKHAVEQANPASVWGATNRGWSERGLPTEETPA
jgi:hypothetical protein